MTVKDGVLTLLEEARGEYVSGEKLASSLGVSRQAVSKAIHGLTEQGYEIEAVSRKGYRLAQVCDLISAAVIAAQTGARVFCYSSVPSTNAVAAAEYLNGGECLVVALSQSAGRSKDGAPFPSPENEGIYLSVALPVSLEAEGIDGFREACACAVERVIAASSGKRAERVRLDEFFIGGKKAAGILVEFMVNGATKLTEFAVVGVGIYTGATFSCEIAPIDAKDSRNRMIIELWQELIKLKK